MMVAPEAVLFDLDDMRWSATPVNALGAGMAAVWRNRMATSAPDDVVQEITSPVEPSAMPGAASLRSAERTHVGGGDRR